MSWNWTPSNYATNYASSSMGYSLEPVKDYDSLIANLERVEKEVKKQQQDTGSLPPTPVSPRMTPDLFAIMEGRERFHHHSRTCARDLRRWRQSRYLEMMSNLAPKP